MILLVAACTEAPATDSSAPAGADPWRRAADGRIELYRGANVTGANKTTPDLLAPDPDAFGLLPQEGVGLARYLVFWQGVEPEPGVYDDDYLAGVHAQVAALGDLGVRVVIDMHQDVWGEGFGFTGAPDWSCDASNYETFVPNPIWSLDYFTDEVTACFDGLWGDPALQDDYGAMYAHTVDALGDLDTIVGWEVMNEPFWGSTPSTEYEAEVLAPFYERVGAAIRAADPDREVWVEPGLNTSTLLTASTLPDLDLAGPVVLAPHLYPGWTSSDAYPGDLDDESAWLAAIQALGQDHGWATALSETGTYVSQDGAADYLRDLSVLADGAGFDVAWWAFDPPGDFGLLDDAGDAWGDTARAGFAVPQLHLAPGVPGGATWDGATLTLTLTADGDGPPEVELLVPDGTTLGSVGGDATGLTVEGRVATVTLPAEQASWTFSVGP